MTKSLIVWFSWGFVELVRCPIIFFFFITGLLSLFFISITTSHFPKFFIYLTVDVKYPERRRLKIIDKIPPIDPGIRPPKMPRDLYLMRGPEPIHNKLQYGDYGIQVCSLSSMASIRKIMIYL